MLKALRIRNPGALSSIQDGGRPGLRRFGIPPSGAMDHYSYAAGNLLVGNAPGAAAIEITLLGLEVETLAPLTAAITGADVDARLNHGPAPSWTAFSLQPGDRLSFKGCRAGWRAYLAVRGGLAGREYLGSQSTFVLGRIGSPLKAGDVLCVGPTPVQPVEIGRSVAPDFIPSFTGPAWIRVIMGPQSEYFTAGGIDTFLRSDYRLSPRSDRQGVRTQGPPIEIAKGPDIISDPTPVGAVQVPGDGLPLILHRDGQVTGGYAKIAVVASADLDTLGRLAPGSVIRFAAVTPAEARKLAVEAGNRLAALALLLEGNADTTVP